MSRVVGLTVLLVVPGGLVLFAAYVLAQSVVSQMKSEQGSQGRRFARALQTIRMRDVWAHTRKNFEF